MPNKLKIEQVREFIERKGGRLLSDEYVNNRTKLRIDCGKGHEFEATFNHIKDSQSWCPHCSGTAPLTIHVLKKRAQERKFECLSAEFLGYETKHWFRCPKGHKFSMTPHALNNGRGCRKCGIRSRAEKRTIYDRTWVLEFVQKMNGKLLTARSLNLESEIQIRCKQGHLWTTTVDSLRKGSWCRKCDAQSKSRLAHDKQLERCKALAEKRGGECLRLRRSKRGSGNVFRAVWKCASNHEWDQIPAIVNSGVWCPYCKTSQGEQICRKYFETLFRSKFPKLRPKWLIQEDGTRLELDGYSRELNLAFEHQGRQHSEPHERFGGRAAFLRQEKRDQAKRRLCSRHGVVLIEIPEVPGKLPEKQLRDFIGRECTKNGVAIPPGFFSRKVDTSRIYGNWSQFERLKSCVEAKGGKLLSGQFLGWDEPHRVQCKRGHIWTPRPGNLLYGAKTWCPYCINHYSVRKKSQAQSDRSRGSDS